MVSNFLFFVPYTALPGSQACQASGIERRVSGIEIRASKFSNSDTFFITPKRAAYVYITRNMFIKGSNLALERGLEIGRRKMMNRENQISDIILGLRGCGTKQRLSEQNRELLASADAREVAHAQQLAMEAGIDLDDLFNIWQKNKAILPDVQAKMRVELPENHIIQLILAEHDMILCFVADLRDVNIDIQQMPYAASTNSTIRKLEHIARHLTYSSEHPEREDQVIFPHLKHMGFAGPSEIISLQHQQLKVRLEELLQLVWAIDEISFDAFKLRLQQLVEYIVPTMKRHIFIENNLVLPLALEIINEPKIWQKMKQICDEIGYCAYHSG
ncbi:MAG: hemerythrin domain-containing protein [Sedimentisphaerales bacterium]|nr:hemerythrin domain-containing protein [Sedimentisphaerales bacterium]